jgi:hypothetical protein
MPHADNEWRCRAVGSSNTITGIPRVHRVGKLSWEQFESGSICRRMTLPQSFPIGYTRATAFSITRLRLIARWWIASLTLDRLRPSLSTQDVSGAALDAAVRRGTLFVKRRLGALPYADDPVGSRSLLSRAFHAPAATAADANALVGRNALVWVCAWCGG